LFFIKREHHGGQLAKWFLVQVDINETDPQEAVQVGRYHCRWYIRHVDDSFKEKTRFARFWPEVHELRDGVLGKIVVVRPDKVRKLTEQKKARLAWYQDKVDLVNDRLVGPFDFMPVTTRQRKQNLIDNEYWAELLTFSETVDTTMVDEVDPLK
jgi:hypothetical protein